MKIALNRHSTKAEGGNQKAPANHEQTDCHSVVGTHTDLQAGRGTPHAEDGHHAVGSYSFIWVQGNIRRHIRRELDAEPSGGSGRAVPSDQQQD